VNRNTAALLLTMLGAVAPALGAVVVDEATGNVQHHIRAMSSPIPGWCYWTHASSAGPTYHATQADGDGTYCVPVWLAHCDGDSLIFAGEWPSHDYEYNLSTSYHVTLTCAITLDDTTRARAGRWFQGGYTVAESWIELTNSDGEIVPLLAADGEDAQNASDLAPGTYTVELYVYVAGPAPITSCSFEVALRWGPAEETSVQRLSWGAMKSGYH